MSGPAIVIVPPSKGGPLTGKSQRAVKVSGLVMDSVPCLVIKRVPDIIPVPSRFPGVSRDRPALKDYSFYSLHRSTGNQEAFRSFGVKTRYQREMVNRNLLRQFDLAEDE